MATAAPPAEAPSPGPAVPDGTLDGALNDDASWQVAVDDGPATRRVEESWFCLADGLIGTRGSLEGTEAENMPLVLAAGCYDGDNTLLRMPTWVSFDEAAGWPAGRRVLDLRDGTLRRRVEDATGVLAVTRFACLARPGTGVQLATVSPASDTAPDAQRVRHVGPDGGAATPTEVEAAERTSPLGGGVVALVRTERRPQPGGGTQVQRVAVHGVGWRRRPRRSAAERALDDAWRAGPATLLTEQRQAWAARWAAAEVELTGDPALTRAVRFGLFHLMASVADRGAVAVGARGLSGPAYAGHVFWDADVFVLPFLAATHPAAARAMLAYRIRRLPAARRAAAAAGRAGARFPWESAADGTDVTPASGIDASGRQVPILSGRLEEHITADVAWAAWHLASWTGRWAFLDGPGRDLVVDTARYWASRVRRDPRGTAHIDAVIGPDEYHEDVDDNAFTNVMAAWNLRQAARLARRRPGPDEAGEAERWDDVAGRLVTGFDPDTGVHEQFAGYHRLEPVWAAALGQVPFSGDLVLGRSRLARSQLVKQADVLMAHHMVPTVLPPGSLRADVDHYLPRTCHGSSLSPSIHAAVAARAGRVDDARQLLELATRIDLDDLTGTSADGLHLANLGGLWQALVYGFAGLSVTDPDDAALVVEPRVPADWGELRVRLTWHGLALALRCTSSSLHVGTDRPLRVTAWGHTADVEPPGRWFP